MHLIRRSAFRAINSPASSFLSKSRSITTSSPFTIRVKSQITISPIYRRLASNDAGNEGDKLETESAPSSVDSEDQSSIASAISSVSESASSYASDAAESLTHNATEAKDSFIDGASSAASAVSNSFTPRERRSNRGYGNDDDGARNSGPPQGRYGDEQQRDFAAPVRPSKSIYVGNLLFEVNEDDLSREFGEFGKIEEVKIAKDPRNLSKGFGYVTFDSIDAATAAIQAKHQNIMEGRRIVVNYQIASRRPAGVNPPSQTLFIGNLAFEMSDADLNKLFQDVKNVLDVRVAIDRRTGQPRGFAHADFVDVESAKSGLEYLQGKQFYGRALRVDYAGSISRDRSRTGGA